MGLLIPRTPEECFERGCHLAFRDSASEESKQRGFELLLKAAKMGYVEAFITVAYGYRDGDLPKNIDNAIYWFKEVIIAESNDTPAAFKALGEIYADKEGGAYAPTEAIECFKRSGEYGDAWSQYRLGEIYKEGELTETNDEAAFYWFLKSAENGSSSGQSEVAYYYREGKGTKKNDGEAIYWYEESIKNGNCDSSIPFYLASLYSKSETHADFDKALYWYTEYAKNRSYDSDRVEYAIGELYETGGKDGSRKNLEEAFKHYSKSSDLGNNTATFKVGKCYLEGKGCDINLEKAIEIFQNLAKDKYSDAWYELSECYKKGIGVPVDLSYSEECLITASNLEYESGEFSEGNPYLGIRYAFEHYEKSAKYGNSKGQYKVGTFYENGIWKDVDLSEAFIWYLKSAKNGNPDGEFAVGRCFKKGIGVSISLEKAWEWFWKSLNHGNNAAIEEIELLKEIMPNLPPVPTSEESVTASGISHNDSSSQTTVSQNDDNDVFEEIMDTDSTVIQENNVSVSESHNSDERISMPEKTTELSSPKVQNFKYCIYCGARISRKAVFCSECGERQE
ncbi:MAG TPA: tetratricopeptide repeat protein [Methanocorpusculum sp.]|nr:tetratricopeptide repeat protein [Methanocorpusculum sp.]HJJ57401.1 tetratricopeptide repeat protein [Methanocorpusculum sp.]